MQGIITIKMVLDKRYIYDGKPLLLLNNVQRATKHMIELKIYNKGYVHENVNCVCCGNDNFNIISEKDRYGLPLLTGICHSCCMLQVVKRMREEDYAHFYNHYYRSLYNGALDAKEKFFVNQTKKGRKIIDFLENGLGFNVYNRKVLEIGCGAGGILKEFKVINNKVYGVDLGHGYIRFGQYKGLNIDHGNIDTVLNNINYKPDLIIYNHVLEHIHNPKKELEKLKQICHNDTVIYIEVPGIKNLGVYYDDFLYYLQNAHLQYFSLTTLKNMMSVSGFDCICGNEQIRAVFKKTNKKKVNIYNDKNTIDYLKTLENKKIKIKRIKFKFIKIITFFYRLFKKNKR